MQPVGLIRNLKIDLAICKYKISVTMLNIGNEIKKLFNVFGRALIETCKGKS